MIPKSFRVQDFRSIKDSGICSLSPDGITVLAGQNEAGKSAVLNALRDFDLEEDESPKSKDYMPEGNFDAKPRVAIKFQINIEYIVKELLDSGYTIPSSLIEELKTNPYIWIERDLLTGKFNLPKLLRCWDTHNEADNVDSEDESKRETINTEESSEEYRKNEIRNMLTQSEFASFLRPYWPVFIYFDSFNDTLPREFEVDRLVTIEKKNKTSLLESTTQTTKEQVSTSLGNTLSPISTSTSTIDGQTPSADKIKKNIPQPVEDYIALSNLDPLKVDKLSKEDKTLGNYLKQCSSTISGDFLTYWKQKIDAEQNVNLYVRHLRDEEGTLKLAFYVRDTTDQYPEQRSKGFLWFLSFYLRLAGAQKREPNRSRVLLIDEPGSYLHARAQRDVLDLFEDRITKEKEQQIIYSTHSPYLLPPDKLHRIRIVIKKSHKGTLVLDRLTHPELLNGDFSDTLSPIINSIGLDIRESLTLAKQNNLLVEGISDHMYLCEWGRQLMPNLLEKINVFPGTGAISLVTFASLFIGWGLAFAVVLDRDDQGNNAKIKLVRELAVSEGCIVQPNNALGIEDLFVSSDFANLVLAYDKKLTLESGEKASIAIKRLQIDKILLARTYIEEVTNNRLLLSEQSQKNIVQFLENVDKAVSKSQELRQKP